MSGNLKTRALLTAAIILACLYGIVGLPRSGREAMEHIRNNIHLGLDLRGGTSMVVEVQLQDAFNAQAQDAATSLEEQLRKAQVPFRSVVAVSAHSVEQADNARIVVSGVAPEQAGALRAVVDENLPRWTMTAEGQDYALKLRASEALALRHDVFEQARQVIERKINAYGLSEATIQPYGRGADALLVELPAVSDSARIRQILRTQGLLEWYPVDSGPFESREAAFAQKGGVLPLGTKLLESLPQAGLPGEWYLVAGAPVIRGSDLRDARPGRNQLGRWVTNFRLSQDASQRFARYTAANIGHRAAIVLDGRIISIGVIEDRIADAGEITLPSEQQAADLALNLRAGALPAGVKIIQQRTVEASLGADSIRDGIAASVAGLAAVVVAMLVYYRRSGINAVLALLLNGVILMAALCYFGAALTLPGIAGMVLTIGMAVDSNVLIFERIREELRGGATAAVAVSNGFRKAFVTIVDTHVTTVVSCGILYWFGTAAVKGFAITLFIGLVANMFTAVFVSKVIFDWELRSVHRTAHLSI